MREASWPPRCPPIPSATAYRGCDAMYASSLRWRARPMSDAAPTLTFICTPSPSQFQRRLAHSDLIPGLQFGGPRYPLAVQVRAVGRTEVLDVPGSVLREQTGVELRDVDVVHADVARVRPSDRERRGQFVTADFLAVGIPNDDDGRSFLSTRRADLAAFASCRPCFSAAGDLGGNGADRSVDEEVHQCQEGVLQDREDEGRHD